MTHPVPPPIFLIEHTSESGGVFWVVLVQAKAMKFGIMDVVDLPQTTISGAVVVVRVVGIRI